MRVRDEVMASLNFSCSAYTGMLSETMPSMRLPSALLKAGPEGGGRTKARPR